MTVEVQQSIGRAASVLTAIADSKTGPLRASDIARATGLGASTIARLLTSLEELGYVSKMTDSQSYGIGAAILGLASHGLNQNAVHRESRAAAQDLAQRIGLSVNVAVRDGGRLIYLCHFEGAKAPKSHTMVGFNQPLHASALGKCLLIDMPIDERIAVLGPDPLPSYTANTITTHERLTDELGQIAIAGTATENQELALGRFCIAAPIRTAAGDVAAAISISGRLSLMRGDDLDGMREDLIEVADRISVGLGLISAVPH